MSENYVQNHVPPKYKKKSVAILCFSVSTGLPVGFPLDEPVDRFIPEFLNPPKFVFEQIYHAPSVYISINPTYNH